MLAGTAKLWKKSQRPTVDGRALLSKRITWQRITFKDRRENNNDDNNAINNYNNGNSNSDINDNENGNNNKDLLTV